MNQQFDKAFWETHWGDSPRSEAPLPAHPVLQTEIAGLRVGTAIDAGSGEGAEAIWLAQRGWQVTAVDISVNALSRAALRAAPQVGSAQVTWIEADVTAWVPTQQFDLVTTFYAHPAMPQHDFYGRISKWVAPGGSLLIIGHDHGHHPADHSPDHPQNAVTTPGRIRDILSPADWTIRTAEIQERTVTFDDGRRTTLHDVVVRAERTSD